MEHKIALVVLLGVLVLIGIVFTGSQLLYNSLQVDRPHRGTLPCELWTRSTTLVVRTDVPCGWGTYTNNEDHYTISYPSMADVYISHPDDNGGMTRISWRTATSDYVDVRVYSSEGMGLKDWLGSYATLSKESTSTLINGLYFVVSPDESGEISTFVQSNLPGARVIIYLTILTLGLSSLAQRQRRQSSILLPGQDQFTRSSFRQCQMIPTSGRLCFGELCWKAST